MLKNEHRPTLKKPFEYTGSKYAHGSYQHIINEIPPFTKLVIGFLGACPIAQYFSSRNKKVECSIGSKYSWVKSWVKVIY